MQIRRSTGCRYREGKDVGAQEGAQQLFDRGRRCRPSERFHFSDRPSGSAGAPRHATIRGSRAARRRSGDRGEPMNDLRSQPPERKVGEANVIAQAGAWTATLFSAVPRGTRMSVTVRPDGAAGVHLVHSDAFDRLPDTQGALYSARVTGPVSFDVEASTAGDHALVLDNRDGGEVRRADITVAATAPGGVAPETWEAAVDAMLRTASEGLARMLRFDPGLRAGRCGRVAPFGADGTVCVEFPMTVMGRVSDRRAANGVILFALFGRIAAMILDRADGPRVTGPHDGLTVALMHVLGQCDSADAALAHLSDPQAAEALRGEMEDGADLIPDAARASALRAAGTGILAEWSETLLAALSDGMLEQMAAAPPDWTTNRSVAAERDRRDGPGADGRTE